MATGYGAQPDAHGLAAAPDPHPHPAQPALRRPPRGGLLPGAARLRTVQAELAIAIAIAVVAAILVTQVAGRG
jgi:hypothetical protein